MTKLEKAAMNLLNLPAIECLRKEAEKGKLQCQEWNKFFRECEIVELSKFENDRSNCAIATSNDDILN